MNITYFADDCSMGDTSAEDCAKFRAWAKAEIKAAYPDHDVAVSDKPSILHVATDDFDHHEEIEDFCSRLWDRCPWDFAE